MFHTKGQISEKLKQTKILCFTGDFYLYIKDTLTKAENFETFFKPQIILNCLNVPILSVISFSSSYY